MKQEKLEKLAKALDDAGFELVSVREETFKNLHDDGDLESFLKHWAKSEQLPASLYDSTGVVYLEAKVAPEST
jgi:hypothetical protein